MKIIDAVAIDAERAHVFAIFCDLDNAVSDLESITKIEVLAGPAQLNMGTKWRETRIMFGKEATEEMWVTAYELGTSYAVEAESHGTHYRTEYRFSAEGKGTLATMTFSATPVSLGARLASPIGLLFIGATKKACHQDLLQLKRACELG
jgi:hypothetical protein